MTSSVKYYRDLLGDRERIEAFRRAIQRAVQPGDRVLDVGTGLGTFAFFAADAGASVVWAVDGDP
ncbi:MAG: 50S ribosomal protein L11 methyltransferase, partial [Candidatus Brocadiaceae bacterium]